MIGNRWRTNKEDEKPDDIQQLKRNSVVFSTQIWSNGKTDIDVAYKGLDGSYIPKTPIMAKRKHDPVKQRKKSGDIDLTLKPQKYGKVEKSKLSDLFSNKKYKSYSAKELQVASIPVSIPPKAAALLHIHSPNGKEKKRKLKGIGKSESTKSITELVPHRIRRGSESDMISGTVSKGCVNPAFVYSTPPKDRKLPKSPTAFLSTYILHNILMFKTIIVHKYIILIKLQLLVNITNVSL